MEIVRQAITTNPASTEAAAAIFRDSNMDALHRQTFRPTEVASLDHFDKRRVQDRSHR
jgi:hypothetical protein